VLDDSLGDKTWLIGEWLTIADFSVGVLVRSAQRMGLPVGDYLKSFAGTTGSPRCSTGEQRWRPKTRLCSRNDRARRANRPEAPRKRSFLGEMRA
jgi:glutathione S-transferase